MISGGVGYRGERKREREREREKGKEKERKERKKHTRKGREVRGKRTSVDRLRWPMDDSHCVQVAFDVSREGQPELLD